MPLTSKQLSYLRDKERHPERISLANKYHLMLWRCYEPTANGYSYWGGRGITVCEEWRESWHAFRDWARSSGWKLGLILDRIDNDKGYSPENCRFVTATESMRHRRCTKLSDDIVRKIVELVESGQRQQAIASQFNINQSTVSRVKDGLRWNLKGEPTCH